MTDEGTPNPPEPSPTGAVAGVGTSTSGANLVMIGGGLVLASWLVFEWILNGYSVAWPAVVLGIMAVLIPRADRGFIESIAPYDSAMKAVGYLLAVFGVVLIAHDLRFASGTLNSGVEIIGAIVAYAGYVAAFLGARSITT